MRDSPSGVLVIVYSSGKNELPNGIVSSRRSLQIMVFHSRRESQSLDCFVPRSDAKRMKKLSYNGEFLRNGTFIALNPNEIHSFCQSRHINSLGFIGNVALQEDLACQVEDAIFGCCW